MKAERFSDPIFIAVLSAWVMTVVLHEFAHGLVAYWGGDYTIKERGGLTLNPLQYIDPVFSLLVPLVFLMLGGVPLPGGVTYVRRDLLRSRAWETAVSLAGPAANAIVFLLCAVALHPRTGWIDPKAAFSAWSDRQVFVATLLLLQGFAVILNLVPVPPLDGYQAIAPYLRHELRTTVETQPMRNYLFYGYFLALLLIPGAMEVVSQTIVRTLYLLGFGHLDAARVLHSYARAMSGN